MNITALSGVQTPAEAKAERKLRDACDGIEGMFLKTLLKEGMKDMLENAEGHASSALGYALEQTADEMARNGDVGIANNIYDQISANM
jgi:Rod binding domain-containing protein